MTDIQRAARFFYLQHNAFGGKTVQQHFGTATTSKAWDTSQVKAKLTAAKIRLNGVFVEIEPLERCFKRYTSTPSSTPTHRIGKPQATTVLLIGRSINCWPK